MLTNILLNFYKGIFGMQFGGGGSQQTAVSKVSIPEFQADSYYKKAQKPLFNFGKEGLQGEFNDYYKLIGEYDSPQFQDMLAMIQRDTSRSIDEGLVKQNISRSGLGASILAKRMADVTKLARFEDFNRAIAGRQNLLNTSVGALEGVRAGALANQGQQNQYALGATGLRMNQAQQIDQSAQQNQGLFGQLLQAGLSAAGTAAGAYFGGPAGAAVGGSLGSAAGGAITGGNQTSRYTQSLYANEDPLAKYSGMY